MKTFYLHMHRAKINNEVQLPFAEDSLNSTIVSLIPLWNSTQTDLRYYITESFEWQTEKDSK